MCVTLNALPANAKGDETLYNLYDWHLINLFNPLRTCLDCVNSKSPSLGRDFSYSVFCFLCFTSIPEPC